MLYFSFAIRGVTAIALVNNAKVKITHKRNLPVDEAEKVDLALKLKGKISNEAWLRLFPKSIIPNVEEEMERQELTPDSTLMDEFVKAMQAGKPVPAEFVADALRIDRAEWLKLSMSEQQAKIEALSSGDDAIESEFNVAESQEGATIDDPGAGVQMNGAQVTAATGIVKDVMAGILPKAAGINMLKSFFNLNTEQANALFAGVKAGSVKATDAK